MRKSATFALVLSLVCVRAAALAETTQRWGVYEMTLPGPSSGNPYLDVTWSATFTRGEQRVTVPGFWDGGSTYRVRFSPPTAGAWRYETHSATPELNGKTGEVTVEPAAGDNHGPVEVFQTYYLRHADGTPYHQFGTTCYAWVHQPRELQEQTLGTLAASPFNKIRFCVFPKSYLYNQNEPGLFAFRKKDAHGFDFSQPDPEFWHHFEQRIIDLQRLGIEADIILWHPYDRWGFSEMSDEEDDRYLRYCVARLSAYRNVWWSLANEYDFMSEQPEGHRGNKQFSDWDRFFSILEKEDPHHRPRGIHNGRRWYDHTKGWVTHASLQTSDMKAGVRYREQYRKPILYDECRYEGDVPQGWGNLTGRDMTRMFWLGTMSGCYVGHGETYKHDQDILWWSKGGVLRGESPRRIQWLKDFMAKAPPFHELRPAGIDEGEFRLTKPGAYELVYCTNQRSRTVPLAGDRPYKVDLIDPWAMTETPLGTAPPGDFTVTAPRPDLAFRFTPYREGETLRPEAKITASATEGVPPLTVKFTSDFDGRTLWDFGDGATSDDPNPTRVFEKPGLYEVSLTVTDARGGQARAFQPIAVDRDASAPIVRAGFASGETPELHLAGTSRRGDGGGLLFPAGAPWGSARVGTGVVEDLRGLRSFTVMGWLRPEGLEVGSGGNRILFCLNKDHAGIDLVCLPDGRLRLAVNEWPDSVRNDSAPGRLRVGKWTFFAVTYDATATGTATGENVSWFFTEPSDAPDRSSAVTLDRRTSYQAGPVGADIGPLALGNFNDTMSGFGLDRQFRGEMRGLSLFGSRLEGRGALGLEDIRKNMP
jgi:hypothetical protein